MPAYKGNLQDTSYLEKPDKLRHSENRHFWVTHAKDHTPRRHYESPSGFFEREIGLLSYFNSRNEQKKIQRDKAGHNMVVKEFRQNYEGQGTAPRMPLEEPLYSEIPLLEARAEPMSPETRSKEYEIWRYIRHLPHQDMVMELLTYCNAEFDRRGGLNLVSTSFAERHGTSNLPTAAYLSHPNANVYQFMTPDGPVNFIFEKREHNIEDDGWRGEISDILNDNVFVSIGSQGRRYNIDLLRGLKLWHFSQPFRDIDNSDEARRNSPTRTGLHVSNRP